MQHIHLIGIGGTGLSAIARVLKEKGYLVSGSDQVISPLAQSLKEIGITVFEGHRAENITGADVIVQSSAIRADNPEITAALALGIPVLKRSEFLGEITRGKTCIAIAGTHGKTTTSGMVAWMLSKLDRDPSFILGGVIKGLESNAHAGKDVEFVIEADEYDRMFLGLNPSIAVITNLEHDHPDCYPTMADYEDAFLQFAQRLQPGGTLLLCEDHADTRNLAERLPGIHILTYGLTDSANYQAGSIQLDPAGNYNFHLIRNLNGKSTKLAKEMHLSIPGQHNVQNAAAALAIADLLGLDVQASSDAISTFAGTGRRFEMVVEIDGITLIDDYAHHPTEISATLEAARSRFQNRRIWAVWQPHTYSRTRLLKEQFAQAFKQADEVLVTEIYASREKKEDFSSADVAGMITGAHARYMQSLLQTSEFLLGHLKAGDVVVVLSAGDADQINKQLAKQLRERTN